MKHLKYHKYKCSKCNQLKNADHTYFLENSGKSIFNAVIFTFIFIFTFILY